MISITCAYCGLKILAPDSVSGREGACLNCGNPIVVPHSGARVAARTLEFKEGDRIGDRYTILGPVGSGGMGVVYHAEDALVKEEVALKFLRPNALRTEKGRRLFLQEAQIARRLRHENIIAVHDVGFTSEGILYLSMEYAEGRSLRAVLQQSRMEKRYLPMRLVIAIALQVLDALDYAHRLVVHRDIKPENIVLLKNEHVKVLDFGLALAIAEDDLYQRQDAEKQRRKKRVVGTLGYAAPEQVNHQSIDLRADIYAFGLVMRELISLRTPLELAPDAPLNRADAAPAILEVVRRAVRADKNERWQSAKQFRQALQTAFDSAYKKRHAPVCREDTGRAMNTEGMVYFEGGAFHRGNNAVPDQAPEAEVYVAPFWMDKCPVTVAQYARYLDATGVEEPRFWRDPQYNGPEQPVVGVSWQEALAYAAWAGRQLPTEAQWEFAARGRENRRYPWGTLPPDTTRCNYRNYLGMPSMVTMHEDGCSPEGLFDMAGNVYEWTQDAYVPYGAADQAAPAKSVEPRKSVRGGCFESGPEEMITTARKGVFPNERQRAIGFRCVINTEADP